MTRAVRFSKDWDQILEDLGPGVEQRMARAVHLAHTRIGRDFVRTAREQIRAGIFAPNSPVTVAIKGSSKPLVADGDLFQSLAFETPSPVEAHFGVMRTKSGDKLVNIGATLHDGAVIDLALHPQVRAALWAKVRSATSAERVRGLRGASKKAVVTASAKLGSSRTGTPMTNRQRSAWFGRMKREGKLVRAPSAGTGKIVIPPRPFITSVFERQDFREAALDHYEEAITVALGGRK